MAAKLGEDSDDFASISDPDQLDDVVKKWRERARGGPSTDEALQRLVYDLSHHVLSGRVEKDAAIEFLDSMSEITSDDREAQNDDREDGEQRSPARSRNDRLAAVLADLFTIIDVELSAGGKGEEGDERKTRFLEWAASCKSFVSEDVLKDRLEPDTLEALEVLKSAKMFNQRCIRTKTKLFYKQQKYNLMREDNEGYAKLQTELNQQLDSIPIASLLDNIKSLIGRFNLDPSRVLDVALESFECRPERKEFYFDFLSQYGFKGSTVCQIIGFKFQHYKDSFTPESLLHVAALLLQQNVIDLSELYSHLSPSDESIREKDEKRMKEAQLKASKIANPSLAEKAAEEEDEEQGVNSSAQDAFENNQKFSLCESLLKIGDWRDASFIIRRLPPYCVTMQLDAARALARLIHIKIEAFYRANFAPAMSRGMSKRLELSLSSSTSFSVCSSFVELLDGVFPMLNCLGPYLAVDSLLFSKIVRIGRAFLVEYNRTASKSEKYNDVWSGFCGVADRALLPALSLLHCNCGLAEELWSLFRHLPYTVRYRLYGQWKNETYSLCPHLILSKAATIGRAKYVMKRLSKENVKPSGRQLGKESHSNPTIMFNYLLTQIQRFDNFIGPVVDSLKYLTSLAYDVLAYCLIEALANPEKERMKHADTNVSSWLQGLANFAGSVFRKYAIDLTGLFQYVANQLKAGKSFDLLVLKEVVQRMAGIEISEDVTVNQLAALSGGELLKAEAGYFAQVRNTKKSSQRLCETLFQSNLGVPLCLLMGQQRNSIVFNEGNDKHLKLVGKLYDECQDTLVQFGGFLATNLSAEDYESRMPGIQELCKNFHLQPDVAFFLTRPRLVHAIKTKFLELRGSSGKSQKSLKRDALNRCYIRAIEHVIQPIVVSARALHTSKVWDDINPQLYVTFWSLSLYDLRVPNEQYDIEVAKLQRIAEDADLNPDLTSGKKKRERERCDVLIKRLQDEQLSQQDNHDLVMARLQQEKENWFNNKIHKNRMITHLLQLCIFPRCCFTALDAIYCSKFIHILHQLKTPNFSTLLFSDRVFSDVARTVACCTEHEASRYGRFICGILELIARWHGSKEIYELECDRFPGFLKKIGTDSHAKSTSDDEYLDYESFRHICFKWHFKLTKSLVSCLESKEFTQIRNSLLILQKIVEFYPVIMSLGDALETRILRIRDEEKEERKDLHALALGYIGLLRNCQKRYVPESQFHIKSERELAAQARQSTSGLSESKQTDGETGGSSNQEKSKLHSLRKEKTPSSSPSSTPRVVVREEASATAKSMQSPGRGGGGRELSAGDDKRPSSQSQQSQQQGLRPSGGNSRKDDGAVSPGRRERDRGDLSARGHDAPPSFSSRDDKVDHDSERDKYKRRSRDSSRDSSKETAAAAAASGRSSKESGKKFDDDWKKGGKDTHSPSVHAKFHDPDDDVRDSKRRKVPSKDEPSPRNVGRDRDRSDKDKGHEGNEKERERDKLKLNERKRATADREKESNGDAKRHKSETESQAGTGGAAGGSSTAKDQPAKPKRMIRLNRAPSPADKKPTRSSRESSARGSGGNSDPKVRDGRSVISTRASRERGGGGGDDPNKRHGSGGGGSAGHQHQREKY